MQVRVLVAGLYNGPDHHNPTQAQPGDVIEVAGGWYAAELVERGMVSTDLVPVAPASQDSTPAAPVEPEPTETPGKGRRATGRK